MRMLLRKSIILEAAVLTAIFIITYKLTFSETSIIKPTSNKNEITKIPTDVFDSIDHLANQDGYDPIHIVDVNVDVTTTVSSAATGNVKDTTEKNAGSTNSNSNSKPQIHPGLDPVIGKNLLIDTYERVNATLLTLCRNEDLNGILGSIRNLEDRFNKDYHYDWVFLNNEPFSEEFKEAVSKFVSGRTRFGLIPEEHWSYPSFVDQEKAKEGRKKLADAGVIYADSESYRHMCRFNSGFFYKHPIMQEYKYYWRVEPDVEFTCDINYDPFKYMVDNNKSYGFTITIHEFELTIESLWHSTKEFLSTHPYVLHPNNLMKFISNDDGETYNLCHFWSNFEIADMDFWRSEAYEEYFQHLDKTGGFFYERWGDAPIHSIAAALFMDREKLHFFKDIGYVHGVYQMCPIEDSIYNPNRCYCQKEHDFTFDGYACGKEFYDAMGWIKPDNWEKYAN